MQNLGLKIMAYRSHLRFPFQLSGFGLLRDSLKKATNNLGRERGLSMVEVLIAVCILGCVSPAFLIAIDALYNAVQTPDEQIQAEALARSQLDDILAADYNDDLGCYPNDCYPVTVEIPTQYSVSISSQALDEREGDTCENQENCNTLQEVKVTVSRPAGGGDNRPVIAVSVWKSKK